MAVQNVGFFGMLQGIYGTVFMLSSAVQKFAKALDNLGTWTDEQTGTFVDEARMERQIKLEELKRKRLSMANGTYVEPVTEATVKEVV